MDTPFVYDKYVTGKNFIGRSMDCNTLGNLLSQGENIVLYEPPKSGKMSLIQQTLFNMRMAGKQFAIGEFSALNIRDIRTFMIRFGTAILKSVSSSPEEFSDIIGTELAGTHFIFDQAQYDETDEIIALDGDMDDNDLQSMMDLPYRVALRKNKKINLIINEFQNLYKTEDGDKLFKAMEDSIRSAEQSDEAGFSYIFCGSMVNAMKEIFEYKKYFCRMAEHVTLSRINEKEIMDHIIRGFLSNGKVIEKELLLGVCRLFDNNMWYINHFISTCDYLSKGYIVESTLMDALDILLSIHKPRFLSIVNDLTTFQLSLLKAILDGHGKFSTAEVISSYGLNSSANVKRLKDALLKKEIITFDDHGDPVIMDPLFKYWVAKYYFEKKAEL